MAHWPASTPEAAAAQWRSFIGRALTVDRLADRYELDRLGFSDREIDCKRTGPCQIAKNGATITSLREMSRLKLGIAQGVFGTVYNLYFIKVLVSNQDRWG